MNTQEFLALILPDGENFFVVKSDDGKMSHHVLHTPSDAANRALWLDGMDDGNLYYAMASFKQPEYVDGTGKKRKRTQENVDKLKCFWIDLDCKGKANDYPDQTSAVKDIARLCGETGLPKPTAVVNSGYGIHAYWVLDESIPASIWQPVANRWRATLDAHSVKHDASCTTDCARILRPIGTFNRKPGKESKPVRLVGAVKRTMSLEEFSSKLVGQALPFSGGPSDADLSMNEMAEGAVEYRPSSIKEILRECSLLRAVAKVGGNVSEPLWHKTLGLVKHTTEGHQAVHFFSKGHPQYSFAETEAKSEAWGAGPTTCEVFRRESVSEMPGHCSECNHCVTSPIQLGYPKVMMTEVVKTVVADQIVETVVEVPALPVSMQGSYKWENDKLWRHVLDKEESSKEAKVFTWVPFCDFYFYPFSYFDDEESKHRMVWRLREREGVYREFVLSGGAMGAGGQALFKELGEQSVTAMPGGKNNMEAYIANFMVDVKKKAPNTTTYTHYGWNGEDFLIGDTLIASGGEQKKVRLGGSAAGVSKYFAPNGSTNRWSELIEKAYGYPGQEQFQFVLCTGFGSPLLHLMGCRGGAVVSAISDASGRGKSTAGMLATGMYGSGRSGELTLTREQATDKAIFAMAGVLNGIPIMVDEMTNIAPITASNIIYTHSQGSGRITLHTNGSLNLGRHGWSSIMNISANKSMGNMILSAKPGAEAELARMIEFTCEDVSKLNKEQADSIFEELFDIRTVVGMEYMTWVQSNVEEVKIRLKKVQVMLDKRLKLEKKDRYWSFAIAASVTGAMIAKEIGLIKFDVAKILAWLESRVLDIRKEAASMVSTPTQLFSSMLTELSPGFIVTDIEGDKRSRKFPAIIREPRAPYTGRMIISERRLYLPQPLVHNWCVEKQVGMKALIRDMAESGWVLNGGEAVLRFPAKGTNITMGQFRCYVIDTDKLEASSDVQPELSNVVALFEPAA